MKEGLFLPENEIPEKAKEHEEKKKEKKRRRKNWGGTPDRVTGVMGDVDFDKVSPGLRKREKRSLSKRRRVGDREIVEKGFNRCLEEKDLI